MIRRRTAIAVGAALLAAPRLGHGQRARPLRFVPFADLPALDPMVSPSVLTRDAALMIYDQLFALDAALRPQPQMLASFETAPDGLRWTLRLREGLRFHDNEPVLAKDCVASLRRWGAIDGFGQALMAATDAVEAQGERDIVFRLKRPFPRLPEALARVTGFVCAMMPERHATLPRGHAVREPVGSGPYRYLPTDSMAGTRHSFERFAGYVPRPGGEVSFAAGPKRASIERVEWRIIPDASTAQNALTAGEIDWWNQVSPDSVAPLKRNRNLVVEPCESTGYIGFLQLNHLHPPFNNAAVRRALVGAVDQRDVCIAVMGEDPALWRTGLGYFCPDTPLANDAGMTALTGPRDLDGVRRALAAAGYAGEKVVVITAADVGFVRAMALVTTDLLRRCGMNVELQESDLASMLGRRMRPQPPTEGGWSAYPIGSVGLLALDPASNAFLRGNKGPFGFTDSPQIEALRTRWFDAPDLPGQQAAARALQEQAFADVPYVPIGQFLVQTAYTRAMRRGVKEMSVFWDLERA
ncbi:MAG: ABC transporter substrate-binding protein [Acetobacteraceae bacterium]|nr:ABC transporter substrate-binding protein [Acetobacteraceae bacterium]